jgi:hypothetical protein
MYNDAAELADAQSHEMDAKEEKFYRYYNMEHCRGCDWLSIELAGNGLSISCTHPHSLSGHTLRRLCPIHGDVQVPEEVHG